MVQISEDCIIMNIYVTLSFRNTFKNLSNFSNWARKSHSSLQLDIQAKGSEVPYSQFNKVWGVGGCEGKFSLPCFYEINFSNFLCKNCYFHIIPC